MNNVAASMAIVTGNVRCVSVGVCVCAFERVYFYYQLFVSYNNATTNTMGKKPATSLTNQALLNTRHFALHGVLALFI